MSRFGAGWWRRGGPGFGAGYAQGGGVVPFDGVFLDTASGDSFLGRLSYTPDAALTVSAGALAFSSGPTISVDLQVKTDTGVAFWQCFDYFTMEADYQITSLGATPDDPFAKTAVIRSDGYVGLYAANLKVHPGTATKIFPQLYMLGGPAQNPTDGYIFSPSDTIQTSLVFAGGTITANAVKGAYNEAMSRAMTLTATSYAFPDLFHIPTLRLEKGVFSVTRLKLSAGFPNARFGFMGDSLTQGRFATTYAEAFPQLIRSDFPGDVMVAAAPGATTADWLNATRPFIQMKPKHAFVLLGANDISAGRSLVDIQADYTILINRLIAANITPVCLTPTPRDGNNKSSDLSTWVAGQGWAFIDSHTALSGVGEAMNVAYDSGDGIHLNSAGNLVVANLVRNYITANSL